MKYSVVIPVKDEQENIKPLIDKIKDVLKESYEIIFIDDGSLDGTYEEISKYDVRCVKLRKNYGQTAAMMAGFDKAQGDIVISMDGDLQNDPGDIPRLLSVMEEGYDMVVGWRRERKDPFMKRTISKAANWFGQKLTGVKIHDSGCSLKVYKKEVVKTINLFGEMHRFIPAVALSHGFSVGEIAVTHHPRIHGKTKYGIKRIVKGLLDVLFVKFWSTFSTRPLHFFGGLGLIQYLVSFIIVAEQIFKALFFVGKLNIGPLLLLAVMLFLNATICVMFGFLSEIMIRTYYKGGEPYEIETFK